MHERLCDACCIGIDTRCAGMNAVSLLSREFLQLAIGGPLTGLAFGMATAFWLRYMYNIPTAEITLTIVATYGTYIVGDSLFHVSAVLAVVTLGALFRSPAADHRREPIHETSLQWGPHKMSKLNGQN